MKPPQPHLPVRVAVAGVGDVPARVDRADDGVLVLTVLAPREVPPEAREASLEFASPRGLGRLDGTVRPEDPVSAPEMLRFLFEGEVDVLQRRDFARVDAVLTVRVRPAGKPAPPDAPAGTNTLDLSGGGVLISDPYRLELGERVALELGLPDGGPPVVFGGRIVRQDGPERKGVEIEEIADADRERIVRYVFARQRLARALTRDG